MYADRYVAGPAWKPGSLALAFAATALPLVALVLGLQIQRIVEKHGAIETYRVPPDQPPPPDPVPRVQPRQAHQPQEKITVPAPNPLPSENRTPTDIDVPKLPPAPDPPSPGPVDAGPVAQLAPVLVAAEIDPRYASSLQPPYPAEEQRAGRDGRVVLRVLIGADGRVHQVERVAATSDAFFAAAARQALARWRFKPATRDGVAVEQWKQMSVRFQLDEQ